MTTKPFYVGQWVATRRNKRGRVTEVREQTVMVQFGSYDPIELRWGQVVDAANLDRSARRDRRSNR